MKQDCAFCEIAKEGRTLKEGKFSYVIFSNPRLMPGHLLVIPKRHVEKISQLQLKERNEIFDFLVEFQTKIIAKLSSGCDIRNHFKPYVKNSRTHMEHLHFHLYPRNFNDELRTKVEQHKDLLYQNLPEKEKLNLTKLLS